jgi:hypothetical protein
MDVFINKLLKYRMLLVASGSSVPMKVFQFQVIFSDGQKFIYVLMQAKEFPSNFCMRCQPFSIKPDIFQC